VNKEIADMENVVDANKLCNIIRWKNKAFTLLALKICLTGQINRPNVLRRPLLI
jgi:hypothetical protein